jgi:DNA processing protein
MGDLITVTPAEVLGSLNEIEAKYAPEVLYLKGDPKLLERGPLVSIVGSRKASEAGLRRAESIARAMAERGIIVVSGLAEGIDRAAHEGAIIAGGSTIAVLGTALDEVFPKENADLQEQIGREHLLVSQFPSGQPTLRKNFPIRNRTMALLTDATVIVEAGEKSGTRHQGWECLRLGRILFLLESVANNRDLTWPQEMIGYGAQVLSRVNLDVVIENLPTLASDGDIAAEA